MADGDDQNLSHNLSKAVFKRAFRTLYFKIRDFSTPMLSSTRTGSWVVMINWTISSPIFDRHCRGTVLPTCSSTGRRGPGNRSSSTRSVNRFSNSRTPPDRFGVIKINCQTIKSHDRAVYRLAKNAADEAGVDVSIPQSGISTDQKLNRFYEILSNNFDSVNIILDEVDLLVGRQRDPNDEPAYSKLLYQLSRASQLGRIEGHVSVAALTNDPRFMEDIDGRAESSFNPQDVVFPDYDANQLQSILERRRDAYQDDVLEDGIIPLSAAFAAQDHGDARKAIDLFRKAGEIADRAGEDTICEEHVRDAQKEERDRTLTQMQGLSTQKKLSLYATAIVPVRPAKFERRS